MLWTLKSRTWMTGKDLNSLLLEKEQKAHQKDQLIKAYDLNCFFLPYEIYCVFERDKFFCINIESQASSGKK